MGDLVEQEGIAEFEAAGVGAADVVHYRYLVGLGDLVEPVAILRARIERLVDRRELDAPEPQLGDGVLELVRRAFVVRIDRRQPDGAAGKALDVVGDEVVGRAHGAALGDGDDDELRDPGRLDGGLVLVGVGLAGAEHAAQLP